MSLGQACAEVGAIIERAQSLFAAAPVDSTVPGNAAGQLISAASTATNAASTADELSGHLVATHRDFANRSAGALVATADTDARLGSHVATAAHLTRSGAARLAALATESEATSRAAADVTTPAGERVILAALKSQVSRTAQIVDDTHRQLTELTGHVQALDYPRDTPTPDPTGDPQHLPESTVDGLHGTGAKDLPIITQPGEPGPPNTGTFPGGTDYVEAIPGSGVWIPSDQISGKLWMPSQPGDLAPPNYEEIAPNVWWPQPPAIDPPMDGSSDDGR
jgi:hypothetical protein